MKLATVQRIQNISPIEGADNIELAHVLGWQVVVKKGEYKIRDLVVYIQIDTVVPETPEFEFLRSKKFRVNTIKLRKQLSQGLIVPLPNANKPWGYSIGDDVTEVLGIKKYEKPDNNPKPKPPTLWYKKWIWLFKEQFYKVFPRLRKVTKSPFPTNLVRITDEERIQNIPEVLEEYKGKDFTVSYKLDGSSITIIHDKGKFRICSRKWELHDENNDWHKVFKSTKFSEHILKLVKHFNTDDIIVQGEAIGRFNGNHHGLGKDEIRLFNLFVNGKKVPQDLFILICTQLEIPHCPLYKTITLNHTMEEILKVSEIKDVLNPKVEVEGLVWRHGDMSFKVINNKYLLKEKA